MCVIVYKPFNKALLKKRDFKLMFEANPHGAGYAIQRDKNGAVMFRKGLMTFEQFWGALQEDIELMGAEAFKAGQVVIHFRYGTHGNNTEPRLTHPFPVSSDFGTLVQLNGFASNVVFHNGVFHEDYFRKSFRRFYPIDQPASMIGPEHGWSDTMEWVAEFLSPLMSLAILNPLDRPEFNKLVANNIGASRVIIMGTWGTKLYGNWIEYKGCMVSNLNWQAGWNYRVQKAKEKEAKKTNKGGLKTSDERTKQLLDHHPIDPLAMLDNRYDSFVGVYPRTGEGDDILDISFMEGDEIW